MTHFWKEEIQSKFSDNDKNFLKYNEHKYHNHNAY